MTVPLDTSPTAQMARVARAYTTRRERPVFRDERITLSHGSGGTASRNLIEGLLLPALASPALDGFADSATIPLPASRGHRLAFTTDSYVVNPLFFPGGDIGSLAVHGTINDLAAAGAEPLGLALGLVLEEGLDVAVLRRITESVRDAAAAAGVQVVTGDTKVVNHGKADQLFVNTSGVGLVPPGVVLSPRHVRPGDRVLLSGTIGEHGVAVMLAREALEIEAEIRTDSAPLHALVRAVLAAAPAARCFKDPTRGGVATALNEIARQAEVGIAIEEMRVPVRPDVRGACEILGLEPLYIANEGKMVAIVPAAEAEAALRAMQAAPYGQDAALVGEILESPAGMVIVRTSSGGSRVLDMLVGDPLPRIC